MWIPFFAVPPPHWRSALWLSILAGGWTTVVFQRELKVASFTEKDPSISVIRTGYDGELEVFMQFHNFLVIAKAIGEQCQ